MENKQSPIKQTTKYKMVIPFSVEKKFRYLATKFHNTEWSGALFYKPEGSFEDGSLTITCKDILLMDIGNTTYTEYDINPDIISYMMDKELLEYQRGSVH